MYWIYHSFKNVVHLIIISYKCFSVGLTHAMCRLFHGEGADLPVLFRVKCLFKIYVRLFPRICLIYQVSKHRRLIFCWEKLGHRVRRKLRMCVFVCVVGMGPHVTLFYSPQAPMKRVWNPLLPQINITEQCESLCRRHIIFENPPEPTLGFDSGT